MTVKRRGALLAAALGSSLAGCARRSAPPSPADSFPVFVDRAAAAGIDFRHESGFDGRSYRIVETVTGGVALLDYDGDGSIDIYFTNGRKAEPGPEPARDALYRNMGDGTFREVTRAAGLGDTELSLGASVADIDGDRDPDLYLTNLGGNRLYRNNGDGTFTDIAPQAGVRGGSMDSGSAFLDMDHDDDLDLYVASYVIDLKKEHPPCPLNGIPGYCTPREYPPAPHRLYRNEGDGRFVDVSEVSGIRDVEPGRGLGVISADFNGDGHPDLYVANDTTANFMLLGDGRGRFTEAAFRNGTAYGEGGAEMGSMGVDAEDYDGDGLIDICVTNYQHQLNDLYRAVKGGELYQDRARQAGIAAGSLPQVKWGVGLWDLDGDGRRDLFISNGHLNPLAGEMDQSTSYRQPKRVFRNRGNGAFEDMSERSGEAIRAPRVSRGAASGDLDHDGDLDVVVSNSGGAPELLVNEGGNRANWALIKLVGRGRNLDALGARVTLAAGGRSQWAERRSSASYLSANDPRLHFGLGAATEIDLLEVRWPDGRTQAHRRLPANRLITVESGAGECRVEELPRRKMGP